MTLSKNERSSTWIIPGNAETTDTVQLENKLSARKVKKAKPNHNEFVFIQYDAGSSMQKTIHFLSILISITLFNVSMAAPARADIYKTHRQVIRNLTQEESNRQIVVNFYNGVFNNHDVAKSAEVLAENYIKHNPNVPNGKFSFIIYLRLLR